MAWFVNLLAAFLTLLAIAFYVVVYTIMLKRTTPQNIVIGGAAGALPPVIGWAAVTGNVGIPALLLFALVFYWTPPHFWALSLRIRKDYAAAGVPMLPVVKGIPETTRQIGLYTILMVAISLVLWAVARMGVIYLGRRGRPRCDVPVAGLWPVAARNVGGGVDGRRDPPVPLLDLVPDAALRRGRGRRPGALRDLRLMVSRLGGSWFIKRTNQPTTLSPPAIRCIQRTGWTTTGHRGLHQGRWMNQLTVCPAAVRLLVHRTNRAPAMGHAQTAGHSPRGWIDRRDGRPIRKTHRLTAIRAEFGRRIRPSNAPGPLHACAWSIDPLGE